MTIGLGRFAFGAQDGFVRRLHMTCCTGGHTSGPFIEDGPVVLTEEFNQDTIVYPVLTDLELGLQTGPVKQVLNQLTQERRCFRPNG
jgi:hypothetical protein